MVVEDDSDSGCAYGTFDFDELEASEQRDSDAVACPVDKEVTARARKPISRARAWFEIRRYFDAEPQKHYSSSNRDEWKTYYAKELLLKAACESLQRDGFIVLDARLAPEYFARLTQQLLLDAPEQAAALQDQLPAPTRRVTALLPRESGAVAECRGRAGTGDLAIVESRALAESKHDRALCDSCLLSLAHNDTSNGAALRPRTKQQFFSFFKTVLHEFSANSIDPIRVPDVDKISVQFCFGNMPSPTGPLKEPPTSSATAAGVAALLVD